MIKIKKTYAGFVKNIEVGKRAYFVELDSFGYEDKVENVANACSQFSLVCICGEEPFVQNKAVSDMCKLIQKSNPYTKIIIETDGYIRPTGMNSIKNVTYFVYLKSKHSGIPFEKRIHESALTWLIKAGAYIIFPLEDEDVFDEINTIIPGLSIKNHQVYIDIKHKDFSDMAFLCMNYGFNIYVNYDGEWVEK